MISLEPTEITGQHVTHGGPGMMMRGTHDAMDMGDLSESSVDQSFDTDADGSVSNAELGAGLSALLAQHDADGNVAHFPDEFATIFAQVMLGMAERPFTMLDVYANTDVGTNVTISFQDPKRSFFAFRQTWLTPREDTLVD